MDHSEGDVGAENIPLPESEDEIEAAGSTVALNDDPTEDEAGTNRPKRTKKPSFKVIQNKLVETENQLEDQWKRCLNQIKRVQTPDQSVKEIRKGITEARSLFNTYQLEILSLQEFTASANSSEILEERKRLEETAARRKEFLDSVLKDANEQIKNLLLEIESMQSSATGSVNSVTSMRLKAKAKAAAALKKAELQKHRFEIESCSAHLIEEEELALARRKRNEKAKLEALRLDEEAAIALATAKAIDEEFNQPGLSVNSEPFHTLDLPSANPVQRVQEYLHSQGEPLNPLDDPARKENLEQKHQYRSKPESKIKLEQVTQPEVPSPSKLDPCTPAFTPTSTPTQTAMGYIEFMARRELISNKIEKFDDRPENFHTWKGSFENMIKGVNLSPSEQLSLIIENTTNESKRLVQRLRNAYIQTPGGGIKESLAQIGREVWLERSSHASPSYKTKFIPKDRDSRQ